MDYWELECRLESSIFTYFAFRFSSEEYEAAKVGSLHLDSVCMNKLFKISKTFQLWFRVTCQSK